VTDVSDDHLHRASRPLAVADLFAGCAVEPGDEGEMSVAVPNEAGGDRMNRAAAHERFAAAGSPRRENGERIEERGSLALVGRFRNTWEAET
jgi:hypothetical protein